MCKEHHEPRDKESLEVESYSNNDTTATWTYIVTYPSISALSNEAKS